MSLQENPRVPALGFSLLGWCCLVITVQPLANVIASYTCQYRDNKGYYVVHEFTSFLLERVDSNLIITCKNTGCNENSECGFHWKKWNKISEKRWTFLTSYNMMKFKVT